MKNPNQATSPTNVLVVGVGGQGVLMISKVLAQICQLRGFQVKQSEVHGMAKRGGSVFSHVRFGREIFSPTIPMGEANILVALEWAEGLRWLPYLNPDHGTFIADTQQIVPPFACRDRRRGARSAYVRETVEEVRGQVSNSFALDATRMARGLGNERVANTILLGVLSAVLDFPIEDWQPVLARFVPPRTVEMNQKAFLEGRQWFRTAQETPPAPQAASPSPHQVIGLTDAPEKVLLKITESWCKGCDICVKMCPERCLALNGGQIVEVTDPSACTGCRICEWLCPDFAISVHIQKADEIGH